MALIIIILIILLTTVFFYLKCTLMQSICTLWFAVISTILTFNYYESVANLLISHGYGIGYAHAGCFAVIFILGFALLRTAGEYVIGANIDLGSAAKVISGITCGLLCGMIFAGNLLVAMGMIPAQNKFFYSRFSPERPILINDPSVPALNADGFVAGLFKMVSNGSMRSDQSFSVLHSNFVSQNHLNRLKIKEDVLAVCGTESLVIPKGENLHPLRRWKTADHDVVLVRMGVVLKKVSEGGAETSTGQITFIPAQIRLVYSDDTASTKKPFLGKAGAVYPVGILKDNQLEKIPLSEVINKDSGVVDHRTLWLDVAFEVPQGADPLLLQFKQGGMVDLTSYKIVERTEETERALNSDDSEE